MEERDILARLMGFTDEETDKWYENEKRAKKKKKQDRENFDKLVGYINSIALKNKGR